MCRKCSLMMLIFALLTFLSAQNSRAMPVRNGIKTAFTLGPAVLPMPGIRFQFILNDHLSLNAGLSYILAAGDFNAGFNFHLPTESFDSYFGARRIFIYHLKGTFDLDAVVAGFKFDKYFVEAGLGFGQDKTDFGSAQTELAILQIGWFF